MIRAAMPGLWAVAGALTLVAASLGACSRNRHTEGADGTASPAKSSDSMVSSRPPAANPPTVGVIYVAGSDPAIMVMLRRDTGTALQLHGDLMDELRRLSGARVEVRGTPATRGPGKSFMVSDYTVLDVDGRRPRVGVLATSGGALWLTGQDSLALADPEGRLAPLAGAKVWVVADTTTSPAAVEAYGVIREPPR